MAVARYLVDKSAYGRMHVPDVLHCDANYDLIAEITGQPTEWVVPRGAIP